MQLKAVPRTVCKERKVFKRSTEAVPHFYFDSTGPINTVLQAAIRIGTNVLNILRVMTF